MARGDYWVGRGGFLFSISVWDARRLHCMRAYVYTCMMNQIGIWDGMGCIVE